MKQINNLELTYKRKEMVKSGAYDGRYREKVVNDKKKEMKKNWARTNYSKFSYL